MDEFNRGLNPLDEYAPVDQNFDTPQTPQPEIPQEQPQTVTVDTADEEDNSPAMEMKKDDNSIPQVQKQDVCDNTFAQNFQPQQPEKPYQPEQYRDIPNQPVNSYNPGYTYPDYHQNIPPYMYNQYQQPPVNPHIQNQYQ